MPKKHSTKVSKFTQKKQSGGNVGSSPGAKEAVGLRVIGGRLRGSKLLYSGDNRVRPMKDRTREAVFNLISTASKGSPGGFDLQFRRHVNEHLPEYLSTGKREPGCRYCGSLGLFDIAEFRKQGVEWLRINSGLCTLPPPSSGGRGGGTDIAH